MGTQTMITSCSEVEIKQSHSDPRMITFIASHELVDSHGELVKIAGMDLARSMRNPILILSHEYSQSAVAEVCNLHKTYVDGVPALVGDAYFPDRPRSNEALADVRAHVLNATSIGFRGLELGSKELPGQTGPTYLKTELLEISLVSIPACATCLITRKEHEMTTCRNCRKQDDELELEITDTSSDREIEVDEATWRTVKAALPSIVEAGLKAAIAEQIQLAFRRLRGRVD